MRRASVEMTQGSIVKNMLLFALPLALSSILQTMYNMADMAVVGQNADGGTAAVAAIGAALGHKLLTAERHAAVAALAGLDLYGSFVNKFHRISLWPEGLLMERSPRTSGLASLCGERREKKYAKGEKSLSPPRLLILSMKHYASTGTMLTRLSTRRLRKNFSYFTTPSHLAKRV